MDRRRPQLNRTLWPVLLAAAMGLAGVTIAIGAFGGGKASAAGPIAVQTLGPTLTAGDLATTLIGSGISASNVTYAGDNAAAGTFSGGGGIVGFDSGIILSSGDAPLVIGPNDETGVTGTHTPTAGDADLATLSGFTTFDAAVLEFDFVPAATPLTFQYVFASDEYNEWVNTDFNDVFAFFVSGTNCATVSGPSGPVPVSINTINNGRPFGTTPNSHPELYVNNDFQDGSAPLDTEMDGLTTVLTCTASVNPGVTNHIKLAIADASDDILDADVFLEAGSFSVPTETPTNTPTATPTSTPTATSTNTPTATSTSVTATDTPTATNTPVTPTNTPTATNTPVTLTDTPTSTSTPVTPTDTPTPTSTPVTPTHTSTATNTPVTPTDTPSATNTPFPPTGTPSATNTPTSTNTPVTPTHTATPTNTPVPPTNTATPSSTPAPGSCADADVNSDGVVDVKDLVLVARAMPSGVGKHGYDPRLDPNHDGKINVFDLMVVLHCLGRAKGRE